MTHVRATGWLVPARVSEDVAMATPQAGIFALGTRTHHHLEYDVRAEVGASEIAAALARLDEPHVAGGGNNIVVGFGGDLWRRLSSSPPSDPGTFEPIGGLHGHSAPSTEHDLWVWIHGTGTDAVLDTATAITEAFAPVATLADETGCFVYHDSSDLDTFNELDGMLSRMFGTSGDGVHDHLLDFTQAVTGSYYFAPSVEDLAAVGGG